MLLLVLNQILGVEHGLIVYSLKKVYRNVCLIKLVIPLNFALTS